MRCLEEGLGFMASIVADFLLESTVFPLLYTPVQWMYSVRVPVACKYSEILRLAGWKYLLPGSTLHSQRVLS